jgi:hypothetical protein
MVPSRNSLQHPRPGPPLPASDRPSVAFRDNPGRQLVPQHPTGALSGLLPPPLDLGFSATEELARLRDEERW